MLSHKTVNINELDHNIFQNSFSLMQPQRQEHVLRFKKTDMQKCTLAGEWLVRNMLSDFTGKAPSFFEIRTTDKGKPYLNNYQDLFFNISHSGEYVTAVISDEAVGIDIEKIRPHNLNLVNRVCTPAEAVYVLGHIPSNTNPSAPASPECVLRFLEIWTAKEAYFKCTGTGIVDFQKINTLNPNFKKHKILTDNYIIHVVTL